MFKRYIFFLLLFSAASLVRSHEEPLESNHYPFTENIGQWHENVLYRTNVNGGVVYFEKDAFHYQISQYEYKHAGKTFKPKKTGTHAFKAQFLNTTQRQTIVSHNQSMTYFNYYIGNNPDRWKSNVHAYENIRYKNLYNGIDLEVYFSGSSMKYDYVVEPEGNINDIQILYKGVEPPKIKNNQLKIKHELGTMLEAAPYAYQIIEGEVIEVECAYQVSNEGIVSFIFPNGYNDKEKLIIDPKLIFSTYSGSPNSNFGMTSTFDSDGNGYVAGAIFSNGKAYTNSTGFFQSSYQGGSSDIVISKFNSADGSQLLFSTYLGGKEADVSSSMIVDKNDNLILLTTTSSYDFPISNNAYKKQKEYSPQIDLSLHNQNFKTGNDIAITKISKDGTSLIASTFFGGSESDGLNIDISNPHSQDTKLVYNHGDYFRGEVVIDSNDNIYIGSSTHSPNLDSALNSYSNRQDGIIAKFSPDLSRLYWSRYHGGSADDAIYSLKIINNNRILIGGGTRSFSNFPITQNANQTIAGGGRSDGYISIIAADGSLVERSTFVGTGKYDQIYFIEHDRYDNIYGFGTTKSSSFPVKNSTISNASAGQFIVKLDPNLDSIQISHVFGDTLASGNINLSPTAFLVDRCLNMYISGWGGSVTGNEGYKRLPADMPLKDAFQTTTDNFDFYLYAINRNADSLIFASFLGGDSSSDHVDGGTSRFDKDGIIYQSVCASCGSGTATLNDFPTTANAYARSKGVTRGYGCNSALVKYDFEVVPKADFKVSQNSFCLSNGDTVKLSIKNQSAFGNKTTWDFYGTQVVSDFTDTTVYFTQAGKYTITQTVQDTICVLGNFQTKIINIRPDNINLKIKAVDSVICYSDSIAITAFNDGAATQFNWSTDRNFQNSFTTTDSVRIFKLDSGKNTFYVNAVNLTTNDCGKTDSISITYIPTKAIINTVDSICENSPALFLSQTQNVDSFIWKFGDGQSNNIDSNLFHQYAMPGSYNVEYIYNNKRCPGSDTLREDIFVQQNNLKFGSFDDTLFCGTGDFEVDISSLGSADKFLWSSKRDFSDTLNILTTDSSFVINQNGVYKYYIKISNDFCSIIDSITTEYHSYELSLPPLQTDSACAPYTFELSPSILGTDSFQINYGNGNFTKVDSSPQITYNNPGVYQIELIGSSSKCNLQDTIRQLISIFEAVQIDPLMDTVICFGDSIELTANTFGTASRFIWDSNPNFSTPLNNPKDSTLNIQPSAGENTYYIRADNFVCQKDTFVKVTTEEVDIQLSPYEKVCLGDTIEVEATILKGDGSLDFNWQPNDSLLSGQNTQKVKISPDSSMLLTLLTKNSLGCKDEDTSTIEVNAPVFTSAQIIAPDSAYRGEKIKLRSNRKGGNLVYFWEPKSLMDNPNAAEPTMTFYDTTLITLTIIDLNTNCVVETQKRITLYEVDCVEPEIFLPTAFTPNNDGKNDVLLVRGEEYISEVELKIYNRWGEMIFVTNDLQNGWDGTYKGENAAAAVYVYHLKVSCFGGSTFSDKGNITLIR